MNHQHSDSNKNKCVHCEPHLAKKWYKDQLLWISLITLILLGIGYFTVYLNDFLIAFIEYTELIWWAILLGLFLGGIIDYLIPDEYVLKLLGGAKKRTIGMAVLVGFLMSACSHGILAISIELYKKGASIPAVVAFLLASPWANLPVTILLFSFFGWKALVFVIFAMVIALITGYIFQILDKKKLLEKHAYQDEIKLKVGKQKIDYKLKSMLFGVAKGSWNLTRMVLWWIMIGMLLAAFARAYVPAHIFQDYFGPTVLGLFLTILVATIIEVCSEGSAPMAFELYRQTGAFGNVFAFLMAGVVTDYTEIGLLWTNIGRKTALWLPVITVPQVIVLAWIFNQIF